MLIQMNIHVLLAIFSSLSLGAMTQTSNCPNTTTTICDGNLPGDNGTHPHYECTVDLFSSVPLLSYDNRDPNITIFWFWYNDVCRINNTRNAFFASVGPDNISPCVNRSGLSITQDSCEKDYNFTRQSMIIKNITNSTSQKYICFLSNTQAAMNYTSAMIYSINISVPTTLATTTPITTSFAIISSTTYNSDNSTGHFSAMDKKTSPLLTIALPVALVGALIILLTIAGAFYYRRRQQQHVKKPDEYNLGSVSSIKDQSSDKQHRVVYGDDTSMLESDHGYPIWRPVQQKT